jgi:hypothetical protein
LRRLCLPAMIADISRIYVLILLGLVGCSSHAEEQCTGALSDATANDIHFAVVTSFFARPGDHQFLLPRLTSLAGLAAQLYTNWTLIAIGDGLWADEVSYFFQALDDAHIPRHKVLFRNMDVKNREISMYKSVPITSNCSVWCFAGANALNLGLDIAAALSHVTHVARLDDDDQWLPQHLSALADAYDSYPDAGFAYTQVEGIGDAPFPDYPKGLPFITVPIPCGFAHTAASWDLRSAAGALRYRQQHQQQVDTRMMSSCCGQTPCPTVLAVDADMWERVWRLVETKQLVALIVPQATVQYTSADLKAALLQQLQPLISQRSVRHSGACTLCTSLYVS